MLQHRGPKDRLLIKCLFVVFNHQWMQVLLLLSLSSGCSALSLFPPAPHSGGAGPSGFSRRGGETGGGLGRLPGPAETDGRRHQPLH